MSSTTWTVSGNGTSRRLVAADSVERVAALPGVKHTAFVWGLPLTGNKWNGDMEIIGQATSSKLEDKIHLPLRSITPDYFEAMGILLASGRGFSPSDNSDAPPVAVINEALARTLTSGRATYWSRSRQ